MMTLGLALRDLDDVVKAGNVVPERACLPNTMIRTSGRRNHLLKLELLEIQSTEPIKYRICFVYPTCI
jgi:hypothetical protein